MKQERDFRHGRRGPVVSPAKKTRITICLDNDIVEAFRQQAEMAGRGYQTMINDALRQHLGKAESTVDARTLRRILREELRRVG